MAMTRQERVGLHKKQERLQVKQGVPLAKDLKEGVPIIRSTGEGLVEYIRNKGILYKKVLDKVEHEGDIVEDKISSDGFIKFGNGLIIQWGSLTHDSTSTILTFPKKFPTAVFMCVVSAADADISTSAESCGTDNLTTSQVQVVGYRNNSGNTVGTVHWIAIGD